MNISLSRLIDTHGLALVIFAGLATVFLWDVLFLGYSLGAFDIILSQSSWRSEFAFSGIHQPILSDSPTAHYPQRQFDWGHVKQFTNAEYNPYIFTGIPWSFQGVGGFITSLPQLFLGLKNALDWSTWIRLVCAGFFMYLLVLELGLSRTAGIFAGVLWTYNLHQIVWLEFPQHLAAQLWIPLVFLFNVRIMSRGWSTLPALGLLISNVLFFTSGYMQIVLYTYVVVAAFNTVHVLTCIGAGNASSQALRWCQTHAVYVAAMVICAVGLWAEVEALSEGLRGAQDWRGRVEMPELGMDTLWDLLKSSVPRWAEVTHVLTPDYYGGLWEGRFSFDNGNIVETSRYYGALGVLFGVTALLVSWRTTQARMVLVFAVTMALVFSMIYRNELTISGLRLIPFADKGSYSRFITLLTFNGCVLAAYGLHHSLGGRYKAFFAAAGVAAAYLLVAWTTIDELTLSKFWYPLLLFALVAAVIVARNAFSFGWIWVGAVVVVVSTIDLIAAGYGFNTRMENERLFPRNNTIRYLLNDPEPFRVAVISDKPLYHPNILSYYDIPVVEGYWTVLPVAYAEYVDELFPKVYITRNGILFLLRPNVEALRLMNVKYILSDKDLHEDHDGLERVMRSNNHWIYRVKHHLPRVFCASDVFFAGNDQDRLERYQDVLNDHDRPVVVAGDQPRQSYTGECAIRGLDVYTHGLRAELSTDQARYLVMPYAFNENWSATLDGRPIELIPANGYHMAMRVPAGDSRIEIQYRNKLNWISAMIFIIGAILLLFYVWRKRPGSRGARAVLTLVALVVVFKSSLSLPGVRDPRVPERAAPETMEPVYEQGVSRGEREILSERVTRDKPLELPLGVPSRGLTQIALLAGTFHQRRLEQTVKVELLDAEGNVLVERFVEGQAILNNNWFTVRFPAIAADTDLRVRFSTREPDDRKSFILWLNENEEVCIQAFYELNRGSTRARVGS